MIHTLKTKAYDEQGPFGILTAHITDENDNRFENLDYPIPPTEIRRGLDVRDAPTAFLRVGPRRVADLLTYHLVGSIILSSKALAAFKSSACHIDPQVFFWRLIVWNERKANGLEYAILWPLHRHEVLDREKSVFTTYPQDDQVDDVEHLVLAPKAIPPLDLFAATHHEWLASEKIKAAVEAHKLTGIQFLPIPETGAKRGLLI